MLGRVVWACSQPGLGSPIPLPKAAPVAGRAAAHLDAKHSEQTGDSSKVMMETVISPSQGTGTAIWVPHATHRVRVVKIERTVCTGGGVRGKINAHEAKESCFNWEGKGRERNVKTTQTFHSLQGCWSPACSSGGKLHLWKGIRIIKLLVNETLWDLGW